MFGLGQMMGLIDRLGQGAAKGIRHVAFQVAREITGRFADQIGMADAREKSAERGDTAVLGAAAGDPINRRVTGQGAGRCRGVGRLAVIDVGDAIERTDAFLAMGQSGKAEQPTRDDRVVEASIESQRGGGGGGVAIVGP